MSSIGNIPGTSNWPWLQQQPTKSSSATQQVSGNTSEGSSYGGGGVVGNSGETAQFNFLDSIVNALGQSLSGNPSSSAATSTTSSASLMNSNAALNSTQNPEAALQAFLQNLFASLDQNTGTTSPASTPTGNVSTTSTPASGVEHHGRQHGGSSEMVAGIQSLLQQLNGSSQSQPIINNNSGNNTYDSGAINSLNSSFQNLVNSLGTSQGQSATTTNAPTLQTFLQNLLQNVGNVQNTSGSLVSTQA